MNRIASLGHRIAALAIVSSTSFTIMLVRHFILLHEGPSDLRKTAAVIRPLWSPPCVARVNFQLSYILYIHTCDKQRSLLLGDVHPFGLAVELVLSAAP